MFRKEGGEEKDGRRDAALKPRPLELGEVGGVHGSTSPDGWTAVITSGYAQLNLLPSWFDLGAWNPSGQVVPALLAGPGGGFLEAGAARL